MNGFDQGVLRILFALVARYPALGTVLAYLVDDDLLKGGLVVACFWWLWFKDDKAVQKKRDFLLFAVFSSTSAVLLGRFLALCVHYRVRPALNPLFNFPFPYTAPSSFPRSWNSFPSDHSLLFFSLAASLWMVSRRIGILAFLHTIFVICVPRIYMGYHYPSDIAAGALIGVAVAMVGEFARVRGEVTHPGFVWLERHPSSFYACAFLWTFEVGELFRTVLNLEGFTRHAAMAVLRAHI